jgi:hypothetical protein
MNIRQIRGWLVRLFGLFHRARREREFAEELESHLALHIEDNLRAGRSPEEARRQAHIKLGGVTLTQELYREQGGLPMLETLLQDLRYGARMMLRRFKAARWLVVLCLAALLLPPLPTSAQKGNPSPTPPARVDNNQREPAATAKEIEH